MNRKEAIERLQDLHDKVVDAYRADYGHVGYEETRTLINRIYDDLPQWISVKDRLPIDDKDVLAYNPHRIELLIAHLHKGVWYDEDEDIVTWNQDISYWHELPQPPKED